MPIPPVKIDDDDYLYRRLGPDHTRPDGSVNSNAYYLDGRPDPEPSANLRSLMTEQQAVAEARARGPKFRVGVLSVRELRAAGFDAAHRPTDDNPAHCVIIGNTRKATCRELARLTNTL